MPFLALGACFGGGGALSNKQAETAGNFRVVSINVGQGVVWELNRPIRIEFNHPIAPNSLNFGSVIIRPVEGQGISQPVTGSFTFEAGSNNRVVVFQPTCPTNDLNDNGAFLPGGFEYEILLPTNQKFGNTILRDTSGHPLSVGLSRAFFSPNPPSQSLFVDLDPTPPAITQVNWPERLNFYTDPEPIIEVQFNQPIDGRSSNLNTTNLYILYSDELVSSGSPPTFPATNVLPGSLTLAKNCTATGATVHFHIGGILPPDRHLRLTMTNSFRDIAGQSNSATTSQPLHETPTLAAIYDDPSWNSGLETVDEFRDDFADQGMLDVEAALTLPPAEHIDGEMSASFDYPGQFVSGDDDLSWTETSGEIFTDGVTNFTDSNNRSFTITNGVLYVDDFYIATGSELRGRGTNPLVIYAQGRVEINGTLIASGNDSHWPTSLNSPQFPEGGAAGECGGGRGGTASLQGLRETSRGEPGDGPFGLFGNGGQGGEGSFQQSQSVGSNSQECARIAAGGGGGGTFNLRENSAILWHKWESDQKPNGSDNRGPDHEADRQPYWPDGVWRDQNTVGLEPDQVMLPVYGGEDGIRGTSWEADRITPQDPFPTQPHGAYGMEDEAVDQVSPTDSWGNFDPAWNGGATIPFDYGHPTRGPDGGAAGKSVFSPDGDTGNDFWGRRLNNDGSVTVGELLAPWAGSGGGASGDAQKFPRTINPNPPPTYLPLPDTFPASPFPPLGGYYRKGAPGGGGGGQLLIFAIGEIKLGLNCKLQCNGGIGQGGESVIYTYNQISGSGGGSGGHMVLHSATRLDLSSINVGVASSAPDVVNLNAAYKIQAIGGRRGWCGSALNSPYDGNGDLMIARGGAGGDGVIQVHVPDPSTDIVWPVQARNGINQYLNLGGAFDRDKVEGILGIFMNPQPYVLLPFFSAGSQFQSKWVDTGLAGLRDPQNPNGSGYEGPYPDYADPKLDFEGTNTAGFVKTGAGKVLPEGDIASGSTGAVTIGNTTLTVPAASAYFSADFLRHPAALVGYDVMPDQSNDNASFEVVDSVYERGTDTLTLTTRNTDGALTFAVNPANPTWSVREKFFRIATSGQKDGLPSSASVKIEFQACDDPDDPATYAPTPNKPNDWTTETADLQGKRFIRYRVSFNIDQQKTGVSPSSPRPTMDYFKLPFVW